jgi:hypothetical protein
MQEPSGPARSTLTQPRRLDDQRHAARRAWGDRAGAKRGLDGIGFTIYSLPREVRARIEYLDDRRPAAVGR